MVILSNWVDKLKHNLRPYLEEKEIVPEEEPSLIDEIKEAHRQWIEARQYFNNVSEPELIDHAAYKIEAAKIKYMYLLNKAKKM